MDHLPHRAFYKALEVLQVKVGNQEPFNFNSNNIVDVPFGFLLTCFFMDDLIYVNIVIIYVSPIKVLVIYI